MSQSDFRNCYAALVFAICLVVFPLPRRDQQPGAQQPGAQQDQNKQKKKEQGKDSSGAKDNPPKNSQPADGAKSNDKPAPLFGGSLNIKSSRQTKDSATLGFNGVDDNGKVQQAFLTAAPSGADAAAVSRMEAAPVADSDVTDFIAQGGLNSIAPPKKAAAPGGKP
jgi:hypothetical protein